MNKEFIPYEQALELKELGFDEYCYAKYNRKEFQHNSLGGGINYNDSSYDNNLISAPLYQQAFRFFREKYDFTYSIGKTNIAVVHYLGTTQLLQNNDSYEAAELEAIKWFIDVAKQQ
jgi:hypothetical protein